MYKRINAIAITSWFSKIYINNYILSSLYFPCTIFFRFRINSVDQGNGGICGEPLSG